MTLEGVDATHPMPTAALRAAGVTTVLRYVGQFRKAASAGEVARLLRDGFAFVPVWEVGERDALMGYAHGRDHGRRARDAVRALGLPDTTPIVATVDTQADPAATVAYGRGFALEAGAAAGGSYPTHLVAVYGSAGVIDAWHAAGLVPDRGGWQTNARGWDQPRRYSPHASIRQHLPTDHPTLGNVDLNDVDPDCPYLTRAQELTVADVQTILARLDQLEAAQTAQGAQLATVATQVDKLHRDYGISREPSGAPGDNGSKRWQLGQILTIVRQLAKGRG